MRMRWTLIGILVMGLFAGCRTTKKPRVPPPPPPPSALKHSARALKQPPRAPGWLAPAMPHTAAAPKDVEDTDFPSQPAQLGDNIVLLVKRKGPENEIAAFHKANGGKVTKFKHIKWDAVELPKHRPADRVKLKARFIRAYQESPLFERVRLSMPVQVTRTPDDPHWTNQWGPIKIQAPAAWDLRASNDVIVAVIDTGIDFDHPDLRDNLWTGPAGEHGYSIFGGNVTEGGKDDHYHGTHVAGTIGAVGNNALGVAGLNWRCKLLALKFLSAGGSGTDVDGALAVEKMIDLKAMGYNIRVSNNSWGGTGVSEVLEDAFNAATQAGILNICAAGNNGFDTDVNPFSPAGLPVDGIVSVLASDPADDRAYFSNYGVVTTDLLAPGVSILSCVLGTNYQYLSGTSMASPHVAGVVAMLFAVRPDMDPLTCKSILLDKDSLDRVAFVENSTLGGRLNMFKAVTNPRLATIPINTNLPPVIQINLQTNLVVLKPGEKVTVTASATDPNGDTLEFRTRSVGRQNNYPLFSGFSGHLQVTNNSPSVTLTNLPRALDMSVAQTFFAIDGHGGADIESVTIFMQRDATKVRDLRPFVSPIVVESNAPYYTVRLPSTIPITYAYQHNVQGWSTFWCCYSSTNIIAQYPGLNIVHPWVVDEWGNFLDMDPVVFNLGGSNPPPPIAKVSVDKLSGITPLSVTANMRASDPNGTNGYLYFRTPWRGQIGEDLDWYNPVKKFTLSPLGIHPTEFEVYDDARHIWDEKVFIFSVLPVGLTNIEPSRLSIVRSGNGVRVSWTENGVLQEAANVTGPWTDSSNQSNPQNRSTTGVKQFFRMR